MGSPCESGWNGLLRAGHEEYSGRLPAAAVSRVNPASGFIATATSVWSGGPSVRFICVQVLADLDVLPRPAADRVHGRRFRAVAAAQALRRGWRRAALRTAVAEGARARYQGRYDADSRAAWPCRRGTARCRGLPPHYARAWLPKLGQPSRRRRRPALLTRLARAGLRQSAAAPDPWVDGSPRCRGCQVPTDASADERAAVRAALIGPALGEAWRELAGKLGSDPAGWSWGRMHRASFEHALAGTPARRAVMNMPDVPRGGDSTTPNATGSGARQTAGASFRLVLDVANWDRSTTINVPGASGQPGSPHYADLLPLWADGRYHPLPFSRRGRSSAAHRLSVLPGGHAGLVGALWKRWRRASRIE
jgi:acyl-homoserine lactone acylase PvdQ